MGETGTNGTTAPRETYERRPEGGGEQLLAAPRAPMKLFRALAAELGEPFAVVYVLLESHTFRPEGRYQSPRPVRRSALDQLLDAFGDFLEQDGRHGLWIMSGAEPSTLALDRRGVVTTFGPAGRWGPVLERLGLLEGAVTPGPARKRIPERDLDEARVLAAMEWQWNALEPSDFDPDML
ncbi:MAG: hypothetical protein U0229_10365 [Anaeromyxobacter sp.]